MPVVTPFIFRLFIIIFIKLINSYCHLFNFKKALNSSLSQKSIFLLAFCESSLTFVLAFLTSSWVISLFTLFLPFAYTYFLMKKSNQLAIADAVVIVIFLNFFHLTFELISEAVGLFFSIKANIPEFLFLGNIIEFTLLIVMAILLSKTALAEKNSRNFLRPFDQTNYKHFYSYFIYWLVNF